MKKEIVKENLDCSLETVEALRESESKFRDLFDNANDIITYVDLRGYILDINPRIEEVLGYKKEEIIGKNFATLGIIGIKELPKILRLFKETIKTGKPQMLVELNLERKDGGKVLMEVGTRFIKKGDKLTAVVNVFRDITERKKIEEELKKRNEELERITDVTIGREIKMGELKNKIKKLESV